MKAHNLIRAAAIIALALVTACSDGRVAGPLPAWIIVTIDGTDSTGGTQ